jgi:hypothetical protein
MSDLPYGHPRRWTDRSQHEKPRTETKAVTEKQARAREAKRAIERREEARLIAKELDLDIEDILIGIGE